ncbi:biotin-dependent carboxyltransferase family protein [Blastococcus sp. MG754426]|uniref:5-oxoprolinase subunit C family protein n=1 Tax=unclassified Blastococcus TaxID=2619396 RepID=UPI001EF0E2CD|nr:MULTISPECIES: biotin-dependent carboxyltransferase family protein [unclassified Blastococcus]MCF6509271.1 biotin-dependent carboxyltransferase family protein [Blastococcus sp. MG754426]MCF6512473.1 biotin-dependent carboxyltransferase family protein [Blastococcus sp. MG754427]MCF6736891.1 biotin-dependent carboxyltransferase family protein [Blastococcus sp. KM273129]
MLTVLAPGPFATVQDAGRTGWASIGVPRSGAADRPAAALANRLVGNDPAAAVVEATAGGLRVRAERTLLVAVTGAPVPVVVDGRPAPFAAPTTLRPGAVLALGTPRVGLRSYLAVRGGIDVPPVLGSRSTDTLSGLGPPALAAGRRLPVGGLAGEEPVVDVAPVAGPPERPVLRLLPGPRRDWFDGAAWPALISGAWEVAADSDRVGLRLAGPRLRRARDGELASEGLVPGALQVPPDGAPVLFLADHPVTGGYPVLAVVVTADLPVAAQLRPGDRVRFRAAR